MPVQHKQQRRSTVQVANPITAPGAAQQAVLERVLGPQLALRQLVVCRFIGKPLDFDRFPLQIQAILTGGMIWRSR